MIVQGQGNTGTIITVFSTASAVGKTVLSINLAAQLAKENFKVCVVDFDFQFGDVCHYLKLHPDFSIYNYQESQGKSIIEFLTKYNDNLFVLSAPVGIEQSYDVDTAIALQALDELKQHFDYIIVDTISGFSDVNLVAMDVCEVVLFMGILDFLPTIKNIKIGYNTMLNIGYPPEKIRFILNRSNAKRNIGTKDVESILGQQFYHALPNEFATTINSIRAGVPMVYNKENSEFGEQVGRLVDLLLNRAPQKKQGGSWIKRFFGA